MLFLCIAEMERFPFIKMDFKSGLYSQNPLGYLGYSSRNVKVKNWNGRGERKGSENCWKTDKREGGRDN